MAEIQPTDVIDHTDGESKDEHDSKQDLLPRLIAHSILTIASIIALFPFAFAIVTSSKRPGNVFTVVSSFADLFPKAPTILNYYMVWMQQPLDRWFFNTLIVAVGVVGLTLLLDSLIGFALAKGEFVGKRVLYLSVIGLLIIPFQVTMVPLYVQMSAIGWVNTYWGIIVPFLASPFGAFYMRQYFLTIPDSLLESARMDGCSNLQIFTRIMLPMSKPALSSLAVFQFIFSWGAFLWPLVITGKDSMFVLQVGLAFLTGRYSQNAYGQVLAATILAALPVIVAYLLAQRTFIEGIALTGAKGT
ncbi:carbohydrate ABC transporter permease [Haladaptatus halobius]|uniref:carbohydrate ABC transporter permease n=1 Tax=Haladaptatus halobius TaxID=2884875 RepID=UPI001D0BDC82|nr:carbohydrate ABC transporter permease [Haladaptatus halobius]